MTVDLPMCWIAKPSKGCVSRNGPERRDLSILCISLTESDNWACQNQGIVHTLICVTRTQSDVSDITRFDDIMKSLHLSINTSRLMIKEQERAYGFSDGMRLPLRPPDLSNPFRFLDSILKTVLSHGSEAKVHT